MINRVVIVGRLTRDPEMNETKTGTAVSNFTLAVDRPSRKDDDGEKAVDFIRCVAWRQSADFIVQYGSKGRLTAVDGRLQIREWIDKEEQKRTTAEVVADRVQLLDRKPEGNDTTATNGTGSDKAFEDYDENAMPF